VNRIISILEDKGLVSDELVQRFVFGNPSKVVFEVRDALSEALDEEFYRIYDAGEANPRNPFTFLASSSMRGEAACAEWNCRLSRVAGFARYSALYCDRVYVPLQITGRTHYPSEADELHAFGLGVASILQLRPLIESETVLLQPHVLSVCPKCLRGKVPSYGAIEKAAKELQEENSAAFSICYDSRNPRELEIRGPEAYLEHAQSYFTLHRKFRWQRKSTEGTIELTRDEIEKSQLLDEIFEELQVDVLTQQFYGIQCNATYLAGRAGEAELLKKLSQDEQVELNASVLCEKLTHSVPLLSDLPLKTILRVRRDEPEAFENYRAAVSQIVRDHISSGKPVGRKEAAEIYRDALLPQLVSLRARAKALRSSALRKALVKTAATSAVLGIGVFGGFLPTQMLALFKALGSTKLVADLGEAYANIERNASEVRSHNMYFLLRLRAAAGYVMLALATTPLKPSFGLSGVVATWNRASGESGHRRK